jgi:hypothetical protein
MNQAEEPELVVAAIRKVHAAALRRMKARARTRLSCRGSCAACASGSDACPPVKPGAEG